MVLRALTLVSMTHPGNGVSPIIKSFREKYRAILSTRAHNALSGLGQIGQLKLQQIETLLQKSLRNKGQFQSSQALTFEILDFGISNRRLSKIVSLARTLDLGNHISLEPVLVDGKFILITSADRADYEIESASPHTKVAIKEHSLGILSYTTIKTQGNGYRGLAFVPAAAAEVEEVASEHALVKAEGQDALKPANFKAVVADTIFSQATKPADLVAIYRHKGTKDWRKNILVGSSISGVIALGGVLTGHILSTRYFYIVYETFYHHMNAFYARTAFFQHSVAFSALSLVAMLGITLIHAVFYEKNILPCKLARTLKKLEDKDIIEVLTLLGSYEQRNILNALENENPVIADRIRKKLANSTSQARIENPTAAERTPQRIDTAEHEAEAEARALAEAEDGEAEANEDKTRTV